MGSCSYIELRMQRHFLSACSIQRAAHGAQGLTIWDGKTQYSLNTNSMGITKINPRPLLWMTRRIEFQTKKKEKIIEAEHKDQCVTFYRLRVT